MGPGLNALGSGASGSQRQVWQLTSASVVINTVPTMQGISQSSVFAESFKQATTMRLLEEPAGGWVVCATFRRRSSSGDDSPNSPSSSPAEAARQRFFQRAGQQMVQEYGTGWS